MCPGGPVVLTAGGLCTTGQPPASAKCIQWWCFSQCMCKGREGTDGGSLFLLFYSWSLVLFCLLTMQICRNFITFPVVLTVKGRKALGIFKVVTSCLLFSHGSCWILCRFHLPFLKTPSTVWSWLLNKQFTEQAPVISHQWKVTETVCHMSLQVLSLSSCWNFGSVLLFHLTVPSAFRKRAHGSFHGNT